MPTTHEQHRRAEYERGYHDGFELRDAAHIPGLPEPIYRPVAYPAYTDGHKAGRRDRQIADQPLQKQK